MRMKFTSPAVTMKFLDAKPQFEEVRDEFGPLNREPMSDEEICKMSPEEYRSWVETGRKPSAQTCESPAERFSRVSDERYGYRSAITPEETKGLTPVERFEAASRRMRASYDPTGRIADRRRRRSE
jgi:hypothetical protein